MLKTITIHRFSVDTFLNTFDGLTISEASKQILFLLDANKSFKDDYKNLRFKYLIEQESIEVIGEREETDSERALRLEDEEKGRLHELAEHKEYQEFLRLQMKFAGVKPKFWVDTVPTKSCSEGGFKAGETKIVASGVNVGKSIYVDLEVKEKKENHLVDKYKLND